MNKNDICIYCRKTITNKSREHAIPKSLFQVENRVNLITVPCSVECNNSFSKDNEEFKIFLLLEEETANQDTATKLVEEVLRALRRKEKKGFINELFEKSDSIMVKSPRGIETKFSYDPNMEVLNRIVKRIVSCLYYHKFKVMIPLDYTIQVYEKTSVLRSGEQVIKVINQFGIWLKDTPIVSIGNGTFKYKCVPVVDQQHATLWKMIFYNVITFWATVIKMPENIEK